MAGIGKNRVFDKAAIEELKTQAVELMACAVEVTEELREEMAELIAIADEVPPEARHDYLKISAQALMQSLDSSLYQQMQRSITESLDKLCALIPTYDQENARVLKELTASTYSLRGMIQDLKSMITQGGLQLSLEEFQSQLADYEKKWSAGVLTLAERMELAMTYLKGLVFTSQFSKDPVNLSTGNFYYEKEDLHIGGSCPLTFHRSYNALNRRNGRLSHGWSHNYEINLSFSKEDKEILILHKADGKEVTFRREDNRYVDIHTQREIIEEIKIVKSIDKKEGDKREGDKREEEKREEDKREEDKKEENQEEIYYYYREMGFGCYYFDQKGHLIRMESGEVDAICFTYDEAERLAKAYLQTEVTETIEGIQTKEQTESEENTPFLSYTYDRDGMLTQVSDHTGRKVTFYYLEGFLTEATDPEGNITCYRYNNDNRKLRAVKNARGTFNVRNDYDDKDRIIRQRFPDKSEMHYQYKETQNTTILTERNGSTITYIQDDRLRNIKTIYENGEETTAYNDQDQIVKKSDRNGNQTRYSYDEKGNLKETTNPLGQTTHYTYNHKGQLLTIQKNEKKTLKNRYDEKGRLIHTEDILGRAQHIAYDHKGKPIEIIKPDRRRINIAYDRFGNITAITDPLGGITNYTYDALNRVAATTDGEGNTTSYAYDNCDRISQVTNPAGNTRTYTYNQSGKVTRMTDFDGTVTEQEYNTISKPELIRDPRGFETKLSYDKMWNVSERILPNGATLTYQYDSQNRLCAQTDPEGNTTTYAYDPAGNRTTVTAPDGAATRYTYDALNRLVQVTEPDDAITIYTYEEDRLLSITDGEGNITTYGYDDAGQKILETDPLGNTTRYTYTPLGKPATVTDPQGKVTLYEYHPGGYLKRTTHPDASFEELTYDKDGRISTRTNHEGYTLTYHHDPLGNIAAIKSSTGQEQYYTYDPAGNVLSQKDANGNLPGYTYDSMGNLTAVTDPLGNHALYTYDTLGNLISISQKDGETGAEQPTLFERNLSGQVTKITDPLGQTESFTYDVCGRLITKADKEGFETAYNYAPSGEIQTITYGDGSMVAFAYNALRQLIAIKDWLGETYMERDPLGRLTKVTDHENRTVSYEWEPDGNQKSLTYPDGRKISYTYDQAGRLTGLIGDRINLSYHYDSLGHLTEKDYGNGAKTSWQYHDTGLLSQLTHEDPEGILDSYRYTYDSMGNKTTIEKHRRGTHVQDAYGQDAKGQVAQEENGIYAYTYDSTGRLSTVRKDNTPLRRYAYDPFGNRKELEDYHRGTITEYRYDAGNRLLEEQEIKTNNNPDCYMESYSSNTESHTDNPGGFLKNRTYSYDQRGNLAGIQENNNLIQGYEYGAANRLTRAWNDKGENAIYQYNGLGYRVRRNESSYLLDFSKSYNNLLGIQDIKGTKSFYYDGGVAIMEERGKGQNEIPTRVSTGTNQRISEGIQSESSKGDINNYDRLHYYLIDELGSPMYLLEDQGIPEETYGYDEFGNNLYQNQERFQTFGFTGLQYDAIGSTYYAQAREYQPETGRFISRDSESYIYPEITESLNLYTYCTSNPLNFIDPSGHDCFEGEDLFGLQRRYQSLLSMMLLPIIAKAIKGGSDNKIDRMKSIIQEQFGFDTRTANIMGQVYLNIQDKFKHMSQSERDWIYTRAMSQLGDYNSKKVDAKLFEIETHAWRNGAGWAYKYTEEKKFFCDILKIQEKDYKYLRHMVRLQHFMSSNPGDRYSFNALLQLRTDYPEDFSDWKKNMENAIDKKLADQEYKDYYEQLYNDFGSKGDYSHLLYTVSANLNDEQYGVINKWKNKGAPALSWDTAEERKDITGWLGDAVYTGDNKEGGKEVSFGNDDYIADLDADNIANRIKPGSDLLDSMNQYYQELSKGDEDAMRTREFLSNNPYEDVEKEVLERINDKERIKKTMEDLEENNTYKDTYDFLSKLKESEEMNEK